MVVEAWTDIHIPVVGQPSKIVGFRSLVRTQEVCRLSDFQRRLVKARRLVPSKDRKGIIARPTGVCHNFFRLCCCTSIDQMMSDLQEILIPGGRMQPLQRVRDLEVDTLTTQGHWFAMIQDVSHQGMDELK